MMMSSPVDEVKADIGVIKMDQFYYFKKMMFTTCIILEIVIKRTLKINVDNISASSYDEAELRLLKVVQSEFGTDWSKRFKDWRGRKRRSYSKCYGVIFNCVVSRAVYLDIAKWYSTIHL